ncbi:methanobactin biosynthesis protein MbnB [Chitinimonas lacunae]|uniref:Methanobactin biosynthesis protein MbnB n=1 Tax=Chitinimonas lacunae TaxID=1963018 RepID=A0ABV8MNZ2_9NEIS
MQIGFNFTLGETLELVQRLIREGRIDYCELLIDNFLQVPPDELARAFDCPVGFHIMFSKFLECDEATLHDLARRLRPYIALLQPIYLSDHIARFSHRGRQLFHLAEFDYVADYERARQRVALWQELLGQQVFFENYPSLLDDGLAAPGFFERLGQETGAGVLFDISNAVCAQRNCGLPLAAWQNVIASTRHFHVAGYSTAFIDERVAVDSHDRALAADTLAFLAQARGQLDKPGATLTYERDDQIDYESVAEDLARLRQCFAAAEMAA